MRLFKLPSWGKLHGGGQAAGAAQGLDEMFRRCNRWIVFNCGQ